MRSPAQMIFRRAIVSELTSTASAVFTVLFSIIFSVGLVRILGQAAGGRVDNQAVFELVALTALGLAADHPDADAVRVGLDDADARLSRF